MITKAAAGVDSTRLVGLLDQVVVLESRSVWGSHQPGPASTSSGQRSFAPVQAADNTTRFSTEVANLDCADPAN